jgi:WD40 repeat protein
VPLLFGIGRDSVTSVLAAQFEILAASVDGTIRTFDIRKGRMLTDMVDTPVTSIALSNDTNCVLASCLDSRLLLLERGTGELLNTYEVCVPRPCPMCPIMAMSRRSGGPRAQRRTAV